MRCLGFESFVWFSSFLFEFCIFCGDMNQIPFLLLISLNLSLIPPILFIYIFSNKYVLRLDIRLSLPLILSIDILLNFVAKDDFTIFQISRIEKISHLTELRVLNLAGNEIATVTSLAGLESLTELNLRRNKITAVVSFINEFFVISVFSEELVKNLYRFIFKICCLGKVDFSDSVLFYQIVFYAGYC